MRPSWKWLRYRPAIGLVIDQQQLAMSVVATTPLGRREIARDLQECDGESVEATLKRMLQPWLPPPRAKGRVRQPWVRIGLPESRIFQATVPITHANRNSPPQNFFLEAVQSTNLRAEDRIIDLLKIESNKQPLACLSACSRAVIVDLAEMLGRLGMRVAVIEPATMGLLRAAALGSPPPRGSKLSLRFFLGPRQAIGMEVAGLQPLFWHAFDLSQGEETASILAAYSTLWMLGRHSRLSAPIDTVFIHGRPELKLAIDQEAFQKRTGARLVRSSSPDFDLPSAALGVALNNPLAEADGSNLARELRPEVPIREIFPWADLVFQGALAGGVSLLLCGVAADVDTRFKSARAETAAFSWLKDQDQGKLDAEKRSLEERIRVLEAFQQTRMGWSTQLRTIAADTPETTIITSLTGDGEFEVPGKGSQAKPKTQLIVNFATPLTEDDAMPGEIDAFISALRAEASILRYFPNIEVSGLRTGSAANSTGKVAQYSVVCLPKTEAVKGAKPR